MMAYMNHARTRLHSHGQCVACHYYVPFYVLNIISKSAKTSIVPQIISEIRSTFVFFK